MVISQKFLVTNNKVADCYFIKLHFPIMLSGPEFYIWDCHLQISYVQLLLSINVPVNTTVNPLSCIFIPFASLSLCFPVKQKLVLNWENSPNSLLPIELIAATRKSYKTPTERSSIFIRFFSELWVAVIWLNLFCPTWIRYPLTLSPLSLGISQVSVTEFAVFSTTVGV